VVKNVAGQSHLSTPTSVASQDSYTIPKRVLLSAATAKTIDLWNREMVMLRDLRLFKDEALDRLENQLSSQASITDAMQQCRGVLLPDDISPALHFASRQATKATLKSLSKCCHKTIEFLHWTTFDRLKDILRFTHKQGDVNALGAVGIKRRTLFTKSFFRDLSLIVTGS